MNIKKYLLIIGLLSTTQIRTLVFLPRIVIKIVSVKKNQRFPFKQALYEKAIARVHRSFVYRYFYGR